MALKTSVFAALILSFTAAADAAAADASCRTVHSGALDRVCRWHMGNGETVDVYYGPPSPAPAPTPAPAEVSYAPNPVYYAEPAYYDYGYGYAPFLYGAGRAHMRDRRRVVRPVTFGPSAGVRGGAGAMFENGRPHRRG